MNADFVKSHHRTSFSALSFAPRAEAKIDSFLSYLYYVSAAWLARALLFLISTKRFSPTEFRGVFMKALVSVPRI